MLVCPRKCLQKKITQIDLTYYAPNVDIKTKNRCEPEKEELRTHFIADFCWSDENLYNHVLLNIPSSSARSDPTARQFSPPTSPKNIRAATLKFSNQSTHTHSMSDIRHFRMTCFRKFLVYAQNTSPPQNGVSDTQISTCHQLHTKRHVASDQNNQSHSGASPTLRL